MTGSDSYEYGRTAEVFVAELLQQEGGWYVSATFDFCGRDRQHAPRLSGRYGHLILPDIQVFKGGIRRWVEVKRKASATLHRASNTWEHGINRRSRDHYLRIQDETGTPVWLFVCEDDTGDVLHAQLDELEAMARIYVGDKMARRGMVFYPRGMFAHWKYEREMWVA